MPPATFHVNKAERNEQFYSSQNLVNSPFNEWAVVVLFYVAVHYVDAVLDRYLSCHPGNHQERNIELAKSFQISPIASMYLNLYDRSRDARYNIIKFPDDYLQKLQRVCFELIRKHLRKLLGLS